MRKFQVMYRYLLLVEGHYYGEHFDIEVICLEGGEKANSNTFNEKLEKVVLETQKSPEAMSWSLIEE